SLDQALAEADQLEGRKTERLDVGRILPPRVSITSPVRAQRVNNKQLKVDVVARSGGDRPVTSLRLLLDGRPYAGTDGLYTVAKPTPGEVRFSWSVEL